MGRQKYKSEHNTGHWWIWAYLLMELFDRQRFLDDFGGQAQDEFAKDLLECRQRDVRGFPTFLISVDNKERLVPGYRTFEQIAGVIDLLADAPIERQKLDFDDLSVLDFVDKYESAAVREVSEVFGVSDAHAKAALDRLVANVIIWLDPSVPIYRAPNSTVCDAKTGQCS